MAFQSKNLVKSLSNLRHVGNISKRHHIFKSTIGGAGEKYSSDSEKVLLRRFRSRGFDERRCFSDISHNNCTSRLAEFQHAWNSHFEFCCGSATTQFIALSSENNDFFSTVEELNNFPSFYDKIFVGSCRGLVCFTDVNEGTVFWNPSTNETKLLPPSDVDRPTEPNEVFMTVSQRTGFGFDSKSQSHKFVRYVHHKCREGEEKDIFEPVEFYGGYEVYCLKSDSWTQIRHPRGDIEFALSGACVNDDFYWYGETRHSWYGDKNRNSWLPNSAVIMKYEFGTNRFSELPFPNTSICRSPAPLNPLSDDSAVNDFKLCDFGGSLGVFVYSKKSEKKSFELWVLKGWYWVKEFDEELAASRPLGFSKTGEFLFLVGLEHQLLVYNVGTKDLKQLDIYCNTHVFDLIPYVETVFPLNNPNPAEEEEEGAQCAA